MRDRTLGETIYLMFTTRSFSTGAPTQLAGTPVVSAYEDDGTTEITAGITLGVDHDSRTGLNLLTVVATSGNGFEDGKEYHLVITTGTVGGVSVVGEVVGAFSLGASAAAVDLANATDGLSALKALIDAVDNFVDTEIADIQSRLPAALVSGRMDASVGAMAANVMTAAAAAADFSGEIADAVWDEDATGHQTGGTFGQAIGDPGADTTTIYQSVVTDAAGTNVAADIIAVKAQTAAIETDTAEIGAAGAGLTALATQASVNTIDDFLDTEIAAIKAKTDSLTFTQAGVVDSNVQMVNDVTVTGTGAAGDEWGP